MKRIFVLVAVAALVCGCVNKPVDPVPEDEQLKVTFPEPMEQITKVKLNDEEQAYVDEGNNMAFKFLKQMYERKDLILSPLSLQYALAMAANGAQGETLKEITDFLGYGKDGLAALNAFSKKMLEQLPAVDLNVTLKLTDALLVSDKCPLLPAFKTTVEQNYYAAVENMNFSDPAKVAARINDWASRSTNGFIDKLLEASDISPLTVAFLMNALYFKAKWAGSDYDPMFLIEATKEGEFTCADGSKKKVPFMNNADSHRYAEMNGYKVLALPYAGEKFFMYILLPNDNNLDALVKKLPDIRWRELISSLNTDAEVFVKLPRFEVENTFELNEALMQLGIVRAFDESYAEFGGMFDPELTAKMKFWIGKVIQKAKISVAEWGTEAAAVTIVEMYGKAAPAPKRVDFYADHPFVFVIGEATSGTILFEGTYTGR